MDRNSIDQKLNISETKLKSSVIKLISQAKEIFGDRVSHDRDYALVMKLCKKMLITKSKGHTQQKNIFKQHKPSIKSASPKKDLKSLKINHTKRLKLKQLRRRQVIYNCDKEIRLISAKLGKISGKYGSFKVKTRRKPKRVLSPKIAKKPLMDLSGVKFQRFPGRVAKRKKRRVFSAGRPRRSNPQMTINDEMLAMSFI